MRHVTSEDNDDLTEHNTALVFLREACSSPFFNGAAGMRYPSENSRCALQSLPHHPNQTTRRKEHSIMSGTMMRASGSLGEMRSLGRTGLQVSAVGQGTWAMGAKWGLSLE